MTYSRIKSGIWLGAAMLAAVMLIGCKEKPQNGEQKTEVNSPSSVISHQSSVLPPKPTLHQIVANRTGWWDPAYIEWYGKDSSDFTVTDISGKNHTLSEYKGKNVMLIFWATWCGPCIKEIPHLIETRNTIGEDKLAMLAISYIDQRNTPDRVRAFVAANPVINYTVTVTDITTMPKPYNLISSIPSSFFIDPEGRIKFAVEGMISTPQIKAIVEAER